jgi:ABC-type multidrug transport system fused ATPase/permease subunit
MLEITTGQILVDGIDIQTLDPEYVRTRLVAVPQEMVVFEGSVRSNLDPTATLTDEEIIPALEKLQLWSLVESKGGLDASINESSFSQGEQQLLGFASAMLRRSRVLVLDEATSRLVFSSYLDVLLVSNEMQLGQRYKDSRRWARQRALCRLDSH